MKGGVASAALTGMKHSQGEKGAHRFNILYYSQNKNLTLAEICVIMEWVMKDEPIPDKPRGIRSNQDSGKREQGQENKQKTADVNAALRGV